MICRHARNVYPAAVFERRKAYGVGVFMSRVPTLNDSIHECLFHAKPHLLSGAVEGLVLAIIDETGKAVEQYMFEVNLQAEDNSATYSDLETMFASAIIRLSALQSLAKPLPKDASFTLLLKTHELLTGPNDKPSYDASGLKDPFTASVFTTEGGLIPPTEAGRLGVPGDRGVAYWVRSDAGDPETVLLTGPGAADVPLRPVKSLHAGSLAMNIVMLLP